MDFLRKGLHTVAIARSLILRRRDGVPFDYVFCLSRANNDGTASDRRTECWSFTVREAIPDVYVPVGADRADVVLPMQAVFTAVYDAGRYRGTDYDRPLEPPLSPND